MTALSGPKEEGGQMTALSGPKEEGGQMTALSCKAGIQTNALPDGRGLG
jgi:hypothetical protein